MNQATAVRKRHHRPFVNLVLARFREFSREPAAIFWVYVFPLILVVALGAAFRDRPVSGLTVVVADGPGADATRRALESEPRLETQIVDVDQAYDRLRTGQADLMIVVDPSAAPRYEYLFDPTQAASLLTREMANSVLQRAARPDPHAIRDRPLDEPGTRYIDFLVPGLLGLGLLGGGLWGVGYAIVDMRIRKLLKRYLATPMRRGHFLGAIMASRLLFTISEVVLLLIFSRLFFGVTSRGSYLAVAVLILLGAFQFSGIGLLVASRARTIETLSGLMNAVMLPMWIGSGLFFPIERFPGMVQPLLRLLPLTPLIAGLRGVMLEGSGLWAVVPQMGLILLWGVGTFALALRIFRWT